MVKETTQGNMVLGSFVAWLILRIAACALFIFALVLVPTLYVSIRSDIKFSVSLLLLLLSTQFAYGTTDANGLHYRRYFRSVFVPWHNIVSITQTANLTMSIVVERRSLFTRRLIFLAGPNPTALGKLPEAFPKLRNIWLEGRRI